MARFTLIFEIHGKLSICQEKAASPQAALRKMERRTGVKSKLLRALADKKVAPVGGLTSCWYSSALDRKTFALIIVVRTDE